MHLKCFLTSSWGGPVGLLRHRRVRERSAICWLALSSINNVSFSFIRGFSAAFCCLCSMSLFDQNSMCNITLYANWWRWGVLAVERDCWVIAGFGWIQLLTSVVKALRTPLLSPLLAKRKATQISEQTWEGWWSSIHDDNFGCARNPHRSGPAGSTEIAVFFLFFFFIDYCTLEKLVTMWVFSINRSHM